MSDTPKTCGKRKEPYSPEDLFSKMAKVGVSTDLDTEMFSKLLADAMAKKPFQLAIQGFIKTSFDSYTEQVVQPLIDSNRELRDLVSKQNETISKQSEITENQKIELENQRKVFLSNYETNCRRIEDLRSEINDVQQYSRRTSLRIFNLKIPENTISESDLTDHVVSFINNSILKLKPDKSIEKKGNGKSDDESSTPIDDEVADTSKSLAPSKTTYSSYSAVNKSDIDRCHTLGHGKKHIIVKFVKYHVKARVYAAKSNLKSQPEKVFITEDLTKHNYNLVQKLISAKTRKDIHSFWTFNGYVYAKALATSAPVRVHGEHDIVVLSDHRLTSSTDQ